MLTEVEAAEILKERLDDSTFEELQEVLNKSMKPHQFIVSNKFVKKLKKILEPSEDDTGEDE